MSCLFVLLLGVYMLWTLAVFHREEVQRSRPPAAVLMLQTPIFVIACWIAWGHGAFSRDLVYPVSILAGLLLGHLVFCLSLLATHRVLQDVREHLTDLRSFGTFLKENPDLLLRFFCVALTEEIIYRAAAQPIFTEWMGHPLLAIAAVAAGFSVVHKHFFRNEVAQSAEFVVFALLLGGLYYWTGSLILVVLVHTVRNLESVFLEYLAKVEELGGEDQAQEAIEKAYNWHASEHS